MKTESASLIKAAISLRKLGQNKLAEKLKKIAADILIPGFYQYFVKERFEAIAKNVKEAHSVDDLGADTNGFVNDARQLGEILTDENRQDFFNHLKESSLHWKTAKPPPGYKTSADRTHETYTG